MADKKKKTEPKLLFKRQYRVPLRKGWLKVERSRRAKKAVKTLKEFIAKHMKNYDRDLRKIKVDIYLNNEIRFRGMKKPLSKIDVVAKKYDDGTVKVELSRLPEKINYIKLRLEKRLSKIEKKTEEKKDKKEETKKEDKTEEKKEALDTKEKEESSKEESMKINQEMAKEQKHISKEKKVVTHRKALSR